jgi:hypothetical protein
VCDRALRVINEDEVLPGTEQQTEEEKQNENKSVERLVSLTREM